MREKESSRLYISSQKEICWCIISLGIEFAKFCSLISRTVFQLMELSELVEVPLMSQVLQESHCQLPSYLG